MDVPLPWERLLWRGRSLRSPRTQYGLTDLRLVRSSGGCEDELALYDIGDVQLSRTWLQRLIGTWTITVWPRVHRCEPIQLADIRHAPQVAAVLELLASDPLGAVDPAALQAALRWSPQEPRPRRRGLLAAGAGLVAALTVVAIGQSGQTPSAVAYPADDAIAPGGVKRDGAEIIRFMETTVMPWARTTLAPIVGGADRVSCETCHGETGRARAWRMPAVAALPQPLFRDLGWEQYSRRMDPQLRNAIYGYVAESDKQATAAYMREVVMPGMARLLHRPAYDFTSTYEFNRTHQAFGCYHCHRVN